MTSIPFDIIFKGVIVLLIIVLLWDNSRIREQNKRLGKDVSGLSVALHGGLDTMRNGFGQMNARTTTIVLSQTQANEILKGEAKRLQDQFNVRINGLKSYIQMATKYTVPVLVQGKDTIIYNNTERVYYTPNGTFYTKGDTLVGSVTINDTVRVVVSKGKRESWWKIWKKRPLVTNAYMASPDGSVTELKSVLVE